MYLVIFSSNHAFLKPNKRKVNYTGTDVFIVCYAIDRKSSFANLEFWIKEITETNPHTPFIIAGLKYEFRDPEKFSLQPSEELIDLIEAEKTATKLGASSYVECSAMQQINIKSPFEQAVIATETTKTIPKNQSIFEKILSRFACGSEH